VQFGAGITLHAQQGQTVKAGQPLMTLFTDEANRFERALDSLVGGVTIDSAAAESTKSIVIERVTA
jgi:thymidine phosphorylase